MYRDALDVNKGAVAQHTSLEAQVVRLQACLAAIQAASAAAAAAGTAPRDPQQPGKKAATAAAAAGLEGSNGLAASPTGSAEVVHPKRPEPPPPPQQHQQQHQHQHMVVLRKPLLTQMASCSQA